MLLFGVVIKRFIWRNTLHSLLITLHILETQLLAVGFTADEWYHWLEGAERLFVNYTNHKNLVYLKTNQTS